MTIGPNIMCVGAQKCGTSWLDMIFRNHLDVYLPPIKELHYFGELYFDSKQYGQIHRINQAEKVRDYFDSDTHPQYPGWPISTFVQHLSQKTIDDLWYSEIFSRAEASKTRIEVCPSYLYIGERGIKHAKKISPELKVIIIIRDPVQRAVSQMKMQISDGRESRDLKRLSDPAENIDMYLVGSDYRSHVPQWLKHFPNRVLIVSYEHLCMDPASFVDRIFSFCELDTNSWDSQYLNKTIFKGPDLTPPTQLVDRLRGALADQYSYLGAISSGKIGLWGGLIETLRPRAPYGGHHAFRDYMKEYYLRTPEMDRFQ